MRKRHTFLILAVMGILLGLLAASPGEAVKEGVNVRIVTPEELNGRKIVREGKALEVMEQKDEQAPVIHHLILSRAQRGKRVLIKAEIIDRSAIASASLYYRPWDQDTYVKMDMDCVEGVHYMGEIPEYVMIGKGVEYYMSAFDQYGNGPGYSGTAIRPHRLGFEAEKQEGKIAPISFLVVVGALFAVAVLPKYVRRRDPLI